MAERGMDENINKPCLMDLKAKNNNTKIMISEMGTATASLDLALLRFSKAPHT